MAYYLCVECGCKVQYDSDNCSPPVYRLCEDCYLDKAAQEDEEESRGL